MSHIFISYSRKDLAVAENIINALAKDDLEPWIDWKSIPKGEQLELEIQQGIEEADIFLLLISPDSVQSEWCNKEIDHAVKNGKRLLPILIRDTDPKIIRPEISKLNWVSCRKGQDDFDKAIEEIKTAYRTDYEWLKYHTRLQVRALEWKHGKQRDEFLLRGVELSRAKKWLETPAGFLQPAFTPLQIEFIRASILGEKERKKRLRLGILVSALIIMILPYLWLSTRFYLDTGDYGGGLVLRAGDPGLKILPGFDFAAIGTDYSLSDIADAHRADVANEKILGFWLPVGNWGDKLYPLLVPSQSGLAYWRDGQHKRAVAILAEAVRNNDAEAVKILAYLAFLNPPDVDEIINGILPALGEEQDTRQVGLQALDYIRRVQPELASLQAARLILESDANPEIQVWAIEAAGILGADPNQVLGVLLELLTSQQEDVIAPATYAFAKLVAGGEPIQPALIDKAIAQLETLPEVSQETILKALTDLDLSATQSEQLKLILFRKLSSSKTSEQLFAMQNLIALEFDKSQEFLPIIDHLQNDSDQNVRTALPDLLLKLSLREPARSFDILANLALHDPSEDVRYDALEVFHEWYNYDHATVFDALARASRDTSDLVRLGSLDAMTNLELETSCCLGEVENTLAKKMDDESSRVRLMAAQGLLLLSDQIPNQESTSLASQIFVKALVDPTQDSRTTSHQLAERYTNPQALVTTANLLLPYLQNADSFEIYTYTSFFEQALEKQPEATPAITTLFASLFPNNEIAGDVDYFIWQVNKQDSAMRARSIAGLVDQLSSPDEDAKQNALRALSILGRLDESAAAKTLQIIDPYLKDDNLDLRAEAFEAFGNIGKYYPELTSNQISLLKECIQTSVGTLLHSCSQAILDYAQAEDDQTGLNSRELYPILEDPAASAEVRISIAKALVAIADSTNPLSEQELADLEKQIASEQDAFTRYWLTGVLAAYSNPDTGRVNETLSTLKQEAVNAEDAKREEIVTVLLALGRNRPPLGEKIIQAIGFFVSDPEYSVRTLAIISIRETGLTNVENARLGLDELQTALTSPENTIRWEAVANGVAPLLAAYPELAAEVAGELELAYQAAIHDKNDFSSLSEIQANQVLVYEVLGKQDPDLLWSMITSPNYDKRLVGRAAMVRILNTNPEMEPFFQEQLSRLQAKCRPQACLSISLATEMSVLLQNSQFMEILQTKINETSILDWMPSSLGIEPLGNKYDPVWNFQ